MIENQKITLLAELFYERLKENPNRFFIIQSMSSHPRWEEFKVKTSYLSYHHTKIATRVLRREGVYSVWIQKSPKFFYAAESLPKVWNWKENLISEWLDWVGENRLKPEEAYSSYPEMGIPCDIYPSSYSAIVRIKIFFPHQLKVRFNEIESQAWMFPMLKKSKLIAF